MIMTADAHERVILVDRDDREVGVANKLDAHRRGLLHRAFSVFLVDAAGRILLQRRATSKYHSPGLWTNSCCGHPRPGETVVEAARRRVREELGVTCALPSPAGVLVYAAEVGPGMLEREVDHVLVARWSGRPSPAPREVAAWRWEYPLSALDEAELRPARFTAWFAPALRVALDAGLGGAARRSA